jgi:hypothetical protein
MERRVVVLVSAMLLLTSFGTACAHSAATQSSVSQGTEQRYPFTDKHVALVFGGHGVALLVYLHEIPVTIFGPTQTPKGESFYFRVNVFQNPQAAALESSPKLFPRSKLKKQHRALFRRKSVPATLPPAGLDHCISVSIPLPA